MKRQIENIQESGKAKAAVLDAPLLLEAGLDSICDEVWVVFADSETRMNRISRCLFLLSIQSLS